MGHGINTSSATILRPCYYGYYSILPGRSGSSFPHADVYWGKLQYRFSRRILGRAKVRGWRTDRSIRVQTTSWSYPEVTHAPPIGTTPCITLQRSPRRVTGLRIPRSYPGHRGRTMCTSSRSRLLQASRRHCKSGSPGLLGSSSSSARSGMTCGWPHTCLSQGGRLLRPSQAARRRPANTDLFRTRPVRVWKRPLRSTRGREA